MARLKASTLIEATVAMTLLTIIMGVAWLTFDRLLISDHSAQEFHARLLMQERARRINESGLYQDGQWDSLGYHITQRIELYEGQARLLRLECTTPTGRTFEHQSILQP